MRTRKKLVWLSTIFNWLLGRYLATSEQDEQSIGPLSGFPILGIDALSSTAYGPEAALTILIPVGAVGLKAALPIIGLIILLMWIVYFSYRQTIAAYSNGGGSYTVASDNLGSHAGVLAASALMLDYILTVAVGVSAGVGALVSVMPWLQPHTLAACLTILGALTLVNLRGVRETGWVFRIPTYAFVLSMLAVFVVGIFRILEAHGHPVPVEDVPHLPAQGAEALTLWILVRAFSSGCTAMTGIEAVSNGVQVFRDPVVKNAQRTLTIIITILALLLAGLSICAYAYDIGALDPNQPGYETTISMVIRAIFGRGTFYTIIMASVMAVLAFSANTAFADFPRLCSILANDNFMPHIFAERGRRLVFSSGILVLGGLAGLILILFDGVTDRLIPLYAMGAFLAFTLSQSGMVAHWMKKGWRKNKLSVFINCLGAVATGVTFVVVLVSKFVEGGWVSAVLIPLMMLLFLSMRRHYQSVSRQITTRKHLNFEIHKPIVIVPVKTWNRVTRKAMRYAVQISDEIYGVHVESDERYLDHLKGNWHTYVTEPATKAGFNPPELVYLKSPYRRIFDRLFEFIDHLEKENPQTKITIVMPTLAEHRWFHYFMHNQRAARLRAALYLRGDRNIVLVNVPWYLRA